ncbi:MAG: pilus assembly protein TadG-related protein [Pseudomonadota bacterium]
MIHASIRRWAVQTRAHTAVLFALVAMPLIIASGMAIDTSRQVSLKRHLQSAVDAAALAGARTFSYSFLRADAGRAATGAFNSNILSMHGDADCTLDPHTYDTSAFKVTVSATCDVPTLFGVGISGKSDMKVTVTSSAAAIHRTADVGMMFDLSSSMGATELAALKAAGKRAAEIIIGLQPGATGRVSVIPFAGGVNAGDFGNLALGRDSENDDEGDGDRVCVTERAGAEAFTDADPTTHNVGEVITQAGAFASTEFDRISVHQCPDSPIYPLDSQLVDVKTAIDDMRRSSGIAGGRTAGHLGIAWTWYTLSPNWNSVWEDSEYGGHSTHKAQPYGDPNILKVAILMTDGTFEQALAPGFADSDAATQRNNIRTASENLCAGMRDAGIIIYAVAYDATPEAESLLKTCTDNDADYYFETSDEDELESIYQQIAGRYLNVGLVE